VHTDLNSLSVVHYLVEELKVQHVMVVGHYGCGGVEAALDGHSVGRVDNWLQQVDDVRQIHRRRLDLIDDPKVRADRVCELNVIEQVVHIAQLPTVQFAWSRDQPLGVHGLVYGLRDGIMRNLSAAISGQMDLHEWSRKALLELWRSACALKHLPMRTTHVESLEWNPVQRRIERKRCFRKKRTMTTNILTEQPVRFVPPPPVLTIATERWSVDDVTTLLVLPFYELIHRAQIVHPEHFYPTEVELATLLAVKTGGYPEDCDYCPQSVHFDTGLEDGKLMGVAAVQALYFLGGTNSIFYGEKLLTTGNTDVTADMDLLTRLGTWARRATDA
jgi:hypothetical protein